MCDYLSGILRGRFKEAKKINILSLIILVLVARLFFSINFFGKDVLAEERKLANSDLKSLNNLENIDPLEKIGKGIISKNKTEDKKYSSNLSGINPEDKDSQKRVDVEYKILTQGYPIEEMISEISKSDKKVAAFLIGIAKKESDWGRHSPRKDGKDCYNYWGYKGSYNLTSSGYSCFDSPKQAVEVVGGRIQELVGKKIDTPEKMVVWKCGRDCSWDNPAAVQKWISDVGKYFYKLVS